jgi:hypothetical protein
VGKKYAKSRGVDVDPSFMIDNQRGQAKDLDALGLYVSKQLECPEEDAFNEERLRRALSKLSPLKQR